MSVGIGLALFAAICIGTGDFLGGVVGRRDPTFSTLSIAYALVFIISLPSALLVDGAPSMGGFGWGVGMGLLWAIGIFALARGVASGRVVVVIPIAGVLSALIPVVIDLTSGNRLGALVATGVVIGVVAVSLTGIGHDAGAERSVLWSVVHGAVGGVATGLSLVMMDQAADSGLWPLVAASLTALVIVVVFSSTGNRSLAPARSAIIPAGGMGILLGISFVAIMLAFQRGSLTVISVIASQYPAATILLAALVWRQRPRGIQYLGVLLALLAVGLIAAV